MRVFLLNIIVCLCIIFTVLGSFELYSYIKLSKIEGNNKNTKVKKIYKEKIYPGDSWGRKDDKVLAYINKPNKKINLKGFIKKRNDVNSDWLVTEIYTNKYANTDYLSRRIVPFIKSKKIKNKFLLFFGGSRTFGAGVDDDETYPYYVSKKLGLKAYSYSASGWGPGQFLAILQKKDEYLIFDEKEGIAIYYMIPQHIHRLRGFFPQYYKSNYPKFIRNGLNRVIYEGNHIAKKSNIWNFLNKKSYTFKYFFKGIQPILFYDYHFTADVLNEIKILLNEKKIAKRFIVFLSGSFGTEWKKKIIPYLKKNNIEYVNLDELYPLKIPYTLHYMDKHLSPLGNKILAEEVTKYIK